MTRLKEKYNSKIKNDLQEKFKYENCMLVPKLEKVVLNMGIASIVKDKNAIQDCIKELALLAGQQPVLTRARKSISNFKLREGTVVGMKVTLRGSRMYDFIDRFFNIVSPRISDFRGFKPKGDGRGSYSIGLSDHQVFPELNLDQVKRSQGMDISFITSANNDEECIELLRLLGLPFMNLPVSVTI